MPWPRTSRHARGYGAAWDKLRRYILARDMYLCQSCLAAGRLTQGNHVDHIVPRSKGGSDDPGNLQVLCAACHDAKTIQDSGRRAKPVIGADGWPAA